MANFPSIDRTADTGGGAEFYKGQYASLKFPKFKHQEYPKHVKDAPGGKLLGVAENALEEAEILAKHGLEHKDVDPVAHLTSENEALKAKLAQYEGGVGVQQVAAKGARKSTETVEMLPANNGEAAPETVAPASVSGNPLLKDKLAPVANATGKAPAVNKIIDAGV